MDRDNAMGPLPTQATTSHGFIKASRDNFVSTEKTGKWCIFRDSADVDSTWVRICQAVAQGELPAAIVSTPAQAAMRGGRYVICVFTRDWQDEADVRAVREKLRQLGVSEDLKYKRDIETFRGVYGTPDEFFYTESSPASAVPS